MAKSELVTSDETNSNGKKKKKSKAMFAQFPRETIHAVAESMTNLRSDCSKIELSDEVAAVIAEDTNYEITQLIQQAANIMKHSGRTKLMTKDINSILRLSMAPQGILNLNPYESDGCFTDDTVNLLEAANLTSAHYAIPQTTINIHWLNRPNKVLSLSEDSKIKSKLPESLEKYYRHAIKALQGNNDRFFNFVLKNINCNKKLEPLLPHFAKYLHQNISQNEISTHKKPLMLINALVGNPVLCLGNSTMLLETVVCCILKPLSVAEEERHFDHLSVREYAGYILVKLLSDWSVQSAPFKKLALPIHNVEKLFSLGEWYGAVFAIVACGPMAINDILYPHMKQFMESLESILKDNSKKNAQRHVDVLRMRGLLITACELLLKSASEKTLENDHRSAVLNAKLFPTNESKDCLHDYDKLYQEFYSYFGDMLTPRLPLLFETNSSSPGLVKLFNKSYAEDDIYDYFQSTAEPIEPPLPPIREENDYEAGPQSKFKVEIVEMPGKNIKMKFQLGKKRKVESDDDSSSQKKRKDAGLSVCPETGRKQKKQNIPYIERILSGELDMPI